jgi:hypothetical protein
MMDLHTDKIPITLWLSQPELELLDRAIGELIPPCPEARPEWALVAVRYGLLALADSGDLDVEVEGEIPEFVQSYRDVMARINGRDSVNT